LNVSGAAGAPGYVRGGALAAPYFEWGGYNADESWGFTGHRAVSDWGPSPIHQLMVDNGVSAFFHGHDHQFVHEMYDGIVYQLVPSPGMTGYGFDLYDASPDVVDGGNLPNSGHLRVTVNPDEYKATVEYVRSAIGGEGYGNGEVSYSYTIEVIPPVNSCPGDFNNDGIVNAEDLAVFAGNFGSTGCSGDGCRGDMEDPPDDDIDAADLAVMIDEMGRSDCLSVP
jgi:hypothetical protein